LLRRALAPDAVFLSGRGYKSGEEGVITGINSIHEAHERGELEEPQEEE